jgi:hypothetical protein
VRAFIAHRREREAGILDCLRSGGGQIDAIVERLYVGLQPGLQRAAGRSVYAHLIDLARKRHRRERWAGHSRRSIPDRPQLNTK